MNNIKYMISRLDEDKKLMFQRAQTIINLLYHHGYEAYIVGGAVRNLLMNIPVNDIDITTDCMPDKIIELFDKTIPVGIEHGTVIVLQDDMPFEVTTFREDGEYEDHRRPECVTFVKSLKTDLERRDFTVNAMAIQHNTLYDYFNGEMHIEKRLIKAVGDPDKRFYEDALRIIRALRFMSVLNFSIEDETLKAMKKYAPLLSHVSIERIIIELCKLTEGINVADALNTFFSIQLHKHIPFFKEMENFVVDQPISFIDYISLYIYLFDISLLNKLNVLKLSNNQKKSIKDNVTLLSTLSRGDKSIPYLVYHYRQEQLINLAHIINLIEEIELSDAYSDFSASEILRIKNALQIQSRAMLAINGTMLMKHFNKKGGPWVKTVIESVENAVIHNTLKNEKNAIIEWIDKHVKI
ncbi:CCA tRNA nucleotidyltransferase [Macrococcus armenti]|uniref:CCA tRNA nucleotidyltransferase n=1 Tax=Macrococcus armenti TaxID=2875764 RepID=UPI001CCE8544|nr:CCA tRNA nucleotidyltransferase [Macrococcus armenti]UBH07609.1 CCA tRNA nucleotidyltransferase [Macrococcus armenti]UBH09842.1 CCA tRNA nucleotidyltransferase [Macrococcus armenti]